MQHTQQGQQGRARRGISSPKTAAHAAAWAALACCCASTVAAAQPGVSIAGDVVRYLVQPGGGRIDITHAKPISAPMARKAPPLMSEALQAAPMQLGSPGVQRGNPGIGKIPTITAEAKTLLQSPAGADAVFPQEWGTSGQPFTTNRVNSQLQYTASSYPYRAAGKLYLKIGSQTAFCSGSLIARGVVVTAAHCVAEYGAQRFYTNWQYVPAINGSTQPYGASTAFAAWVMTSYFTGSDGCSIPGVVCPNDVAVIVLNPTGGAYIGNSTGWLGYGWDGYGFNGANQGQITQLGYPVYLDSGLVMQRTDSLSYNAGAGWALNNVIGTLQTGGASGGPWVVNLGIPPVLSGGVVFGSNALRNIIVGVTSWGYTDQAVKQQGASPFTSTNITLLMSSACTSVPSAC